MPKNLWIKYESVDAFTADEQALYQLMAPYDGTTPVIVYCQKERVKKPLPKSHSVQLERELLNRLEERYTKENIAITYKNAFEGYSYRRR